MNPGEIARAGLAEGQVVTLIGASGDTARREVAGMTVTRYDLPDGCVAA